MGGVPTGTHGRSRLNIRTPHWLRNHQVAARPRHRLPKLTVPLQHACGRLDGGLDQRLGLYAWRRMIDPRGGMAMTLGQASAVVALVSAAVAVVVTVLGVFERNRAFNSQTKQWRAEFAAERSRQEVQLRKDFHLEQYRYRLAAYRDVLKTLGAVSDVEFSRSPDKYEELHQNKELLLSTASALYDHLYGEAGLLMTMPTRNSLHSARLECLAFLKGPGDEQAGGILVEVFFRARRYLRADLELTDNRTPENLEKLVQRLGD